MRRPPRKSPLPPTRPEPSPPKVQRPRLQFPLYTLMMMITVVGIALAPASYFMRTSEDDRFQRGGALIFMIAAPMLMVIILHFLYRVALWWRQR